MTLELYNKKGEKIDLPAWGRLMRDNDYRQIGYTRINGVEVSTVWLGMPHGLWDDSKPPMIFETMIFLHDGSTRVCKRYATEEEATEGHAEVVKALREEAERMIRGIIAESEVES